MDDELSATFAALADPTRRAILERLSQGEATIGELAEPFDAQPAGDLAAHHRARAGRARRSSTGTRSSARAASSPRGCGTPRTGSGATGRSSRSASTASGASSPGSPHPEMRTPPATRHRIRTTRRSPDHDRDPDRSARSPSTGISTLRRAPSSARGPSPSTSSGSSIPSSRGPTAHRGRSARRRRLAGADGDRRARPRTRRAASTSSSCPTAASCSRGARWTAGRSSIPENLGAGPVGTVELVDAAGGTDATFTLTLPDHLSEAEAQHWLDLGVREGWTMTMERLQL